MTSKPYLAILSPILALSSFFLPACKDDGDPISSGGFPATAGSILFVSDKDGTDQLYSENEDGTDVQQLTRDPNFPIVDAKWSPDGTRIAVVAVTGDVATYPLFRTTIFVMHPDGTNRYQVTQQWSNVNDSALGAIEYGGAFSPIWSRDSKEIAYSRLMAPEAIDNRDIFVINVDGTGERRVTASVAQSETVTDWSPDGQSFLATIIDWSKQSSQPVVAMVSFHGELQKQISRDTATSSSGLWSPDQGHIVFTSWSGQRHDLFVSDGEGNGAKLLPSTDDLFNTAADWSADSRRILFNSSGRMFAVDQAGGNLKELTPTGFANCTAVSWKRR